MLRQQMCEPMPALSTLCPEARVLDGVLERAAHKDKNQRFADAAAMATALADAARGLGEPAQRRAEAPRPTRPGTLRTARPGTLRAERPRTRDGGWLRTGALLICGVALAAIAALGGVIYMLDSPQGAERRVLLQRALSSILESTSDARPPPPPRRR